MNEEYIRSANPLTASALGLGGQMQAQNYNPGFVSPKPPAVQPGPANYGNGMGMSGSMGGQAGEPSLGGMGGSANPPIDGKAFFRQARNILSHEAFNQFLQSIKRLNNQQQTREETLGEAQRLFGPEHQALYADFESLLNRQGL